jgi:hypothetical protein
MIKSAGPAGGRIAGLGGSHRMARTLAMTIEKGRDGTSGLAKPHRFEKCDRRLGLASR